MLEDGKRIHGLDALRAVAMLLGVVLHATIAYKVEDDPYWIYDKDYSNIIFDFVYFFIHSFRMPLFYLVAGFFCRFLYHKRTEKEFIKNRWTRVGIPFIIGLITIVPLSMFPFRVYFGVFRDNLTWDEAYRKSFFQLFGKNGVLHIWFLYDLLIFYVTVIVIKRLTRKSARMSNIFSHFFQWLYQRKFNNIYWVLFFAIGVFAILFNESGLFVKVDTSLIPRKISYLFFYGYFFTAGWVINKRQDLLQKLIKNYIKFIVPAIIICALLFYVESGNLLHSNQLIYFSGKFLAALLVVLFTFGFTGYFLSAFEKQSKQLRYISDASYWIYLVHVGMVAAVQLYFLNSSIPGFLKFLLSFLLPTVIALVTYQLFVRYSFVGRVLHGPRKRE